MLSSCIPLLFCLFLAPLARAQATTNWAVNNRQITKDGTPFFFKGVDYYPSTPGITEEGRPNSDLFHSEWAHLHDRDLPLMRTAGINAIRVRGWNLKYINSNSNIDHKPFLDKLYNNGVDPIYVMISFQYGYFVNYKLNTTTKPTTNAYTFQTTNGRWFQLDESTEEFNTQQNQIISDRIFEVATEYINHPAIMGFSVSSEDNDFVTRSNCKYWEWLDSVAARIKNAPNGNNKLTLTSIIDDNMVTVASAANCNALPHLDVWGVNFRRGNIDHDFNTLFTDYATSSSKPLLITEFGLGASTLNYDGEFVMQPNNSLAQAEYFKVHWEGMTSNQVCSGGFVFSWVDDWWRNGFPDEQNLPSRLILGIPGHVDDEAYGIMAVQVDCTQFNNTARASDVLLPRTIYFMMGKLFGAWSDIPASAYTPISYLRTCEGFVPPVDSTIPVTANPPSSVPAAEEPNSAPLTAPWEQQITATVTILLKIPPSMVDVRAVVAELAALLNLPQSALMNVNVDIDRSTQDTTVMQFIVQNVLREDGTRVDPVSVAVELRNLIAANDQRIADSKLLRGMEVLSNEGTEKQVSSADLGTTWRVPLPYFLWVAFIQLIYIVQ